MKAANDTPMSNVILRSTDFKTEFCNEKIENAWNYFNLTNNKLQLTTVKAALCNHFGTEKKWKTDYIDQMIVISKWTNFDIQWFLRMRDSSTNPYETKRIE